MSQFTKETLEILRKELKKSIPQLSLNCVIFRFDGETLQVPVFRIMDDDIWRIPGGYIYQNEGINEAAKRILLEQTQIDNLILSQFGTFGSVQRVFEKQANSLATLGFPQDIIDHISQRFVTIGDYSVIGREHTELKPNAYFKALKWINVADTDNLDMDHSQLVSEALLTIRSELQSKPLISSFMPETFTIPELQKLYEAILGRPVDRGNFRQRILKTKILAKIGTSKEKTGSRPPILFKLNEKKYLASLTQDVKLGF